MNRNKRRLYFSLFTLVALLIVAYIMAQQSGWFNQTNASDESPQSDFAIKDTASIDKFIITKSTGEVAVLTRQKGKDWMINGKFKAKPECVNLLMTTFRNVAVKTRVGVAARNNVVKNIAAYH